MKNDDMDEHSLLIIEDDGYCSFFLSDILKLENVKPLAVKRGVKAFEMAHERDFAVVLLELETLSQRDLSQIRLLNEINDRVPIIVVSEHADVDHALNILRAGAFDYLTKPFNNLVRVETAIRNAIAKFESLGETASLDQSLFLNNGLLGKSKQFQDLNNIIQQISPLEVNVLITGESGTGKELFARSIHVQSKRKDKPFVAVNCGALPEELVESLLFGHEKGAFTGAANLHFGYVEQANEGTLFLDEVGELSPKTQVTLLRFIQDRKFARVGGSNELETDVRLIAATNRNLENEVHQKRFRTDLYYRLNVVHLKTPPLRERTEDILQLVEYFSKRFCLHNSLPLRKFSPPAIKLLEKYHWPGNVRELEHLMESLMAILPPKKLTVSARDLLDYSANFQKSRNRKEQEDEQPLAEQTHREAMESFEKQYLAAILEKYQGNVAQAAKFAGIHPVTLHRKLRKLKDKTPS